MGGRHLSSFKAIYFFCYKWTTVSNFISGTIQQAEQFGQDSGGKYNEIGCRSERDNSGSWTLWLRQAEGGKDKEGCTPEKEAKTKDKEGCTPEREAKTNKAADLRSKIQHPTIEGYNVHI